MSRYLLCAQQLTLGYVSSVSRYLSPRSQVNPFNKLVKEKQEMQQHQIVHTIEKKISVFHATTLISHNEEILSGSSWKNVRPSEFKCFKLVTWRYNCKFVTKTGLADQLKLTFLLCPPEDC